MVLPAPPPPDRQGPGDADWLERITRVLHRTARGVVVLCGRASLGRLRDLVVGLCRAGLPPEVVAEPAELADVPVGSVVVLVAEARHAGWLNLNRPVLYERALRLVLFSSDEATAALRAEAPDMFDWISHAVECPPCVAAPHAVLGFRAALCARAKGVEWRGTDLAATFAAALPGRLLAQESATATEDGMTRTLRAAGRAWTAWTDVDSYERLRWLRKAQAVTRRRTRLILVHPVMVVPDFWMVHDGFMRPGRAIAVLRAAGATSPGRLAALVGMEPEAIELLAEHMREGAAQKSLEPALVEQQDPGAWLVDGTARSPVLRPPEWRAGRRPQPVFRKMGPPATDISSRMAGVPALTENAPSTLDRGGTEHVSADRLASLGDPYVRAHRFEDAETAYNKALAQYRAIDDRLGEANALRTLGDLYVRTARLKEAEAAYDQALTQFRASDARLGEANVLQALGDLALAGGDAPRAFNHYIEALRGHLQIDAALGVAGDHLYLARASLAVGRPLRAAVLLASSLRFYASLDDHFDLVLASTELARAFIGLGKQEEASASLIIAWTHAAVIGLPLAQTLAAQTGRTEPPAELVEAASAILVAALSTCEEELQASGEDPYAPLPRT
jgi:tetratricopeptide (TPR) repeat protein